MPSLLIPRAAAVALAVMAVSACRLEEAPMARESGRGTGVSQLTLVIDTARWRAPTESEIPNDSMGASIRRGLALMRYTSDSLPRHAPGRMQCLNCHLDGGRDWDAAPLVGAHARYPRYLSRSGAVVAMTDRVNYCFTRSMAGIRLPGESREMQDILAYIAWLSRGIPVGAELSVGGLGELPSGFTGDTTRGARLFQEKCIACHGADGQGIPGAFPPLWGPDSYSIGASMAREERAASFIWHNMPQGLEKTLSVQEAYDLASYINAQPRPDSPGKELDWPAGGAPPDTPYRTTGHEAYRPPAKLLPRANAAQAVVPAPRRAGRS